MAEFSILPDDYQYPEIPKADLPVTASEIDTYTYAAAEIGAFVVVGTMCIEVFKKDCDVYCLENREHQRTDTAILKDAYFGLLDINYQKLKIANEQHKLRSQRLNELLTLAAIEINHSPLVDDEHVANHSHGYFFRIGKYIENTVGPFMTVPPKDKWGHWSPNKPWEFFLHKLSLILSTDTIKRLNWLSLENVAAKNLIGHDFRIPGRRLPSAEQFENIARQLNPEVDPIEQELSNQSLKLYQFLKTRKHWTNFSTLLSEVNCWRKEDADEGTVIRDLKTLQSKLGEFGISLEISTTDKRTRLT